MLDFDAIWAHATVTEHRFFIDDVVETVSIVSDRLTI